MVFIMKNILPHNQSAYNAVKARLLYSNRTCVVHPTGTGKSIIAMSIIEDNPDSRILYITSYAANLLEFWNKVEEMKNRRMVLNLSKISPYIGTDVEVDLDEAGYTSDEDATMEDMEERERLLKKATEVDETHLTGPVIQFSLYAGLDNLLPNFDIIILDEFHRAGARQWEKRVRGLLDDNKDAKVIGFSATPVRRDGRDMRELFNNDVAAEMELSEAIIDGLLPLPMYWLGKIEFGDIEPEAPEEEEKEKKLRKKGHPSVAKRHLESGIGLRESFQEALIPENATHGKFIVFCRTIRNTRTVMKLSEDWFDWVDEVHRYEMNYKNRDGFSDFINDDSDALRLLFAVDMLNEGIHIKDLDGVIMVRPTESERIYFQQLGRALAVTTQREHPLIFDIVSNAAVMKSGMDFWRGVGEDKDLTEHEMDRMFHITTEAADFIAYLEETEYDYYSAMKDFYERNGHLYIQPGYKVDGHNVYRVFCQIRGNWNNLSETYRAKYEAIGMDPEITSKWMKGFWAARDYFEEFGNLEPPSNLGEYHGVWLYQWLGRNREKQNLLYERQKVLLDSIGMDWTIVDPWDEKFKELVNYKKEHGHTDVPGDEGPLGKWVAMQRWNVPEGERKALLDSLGFEWDGRKSRSRNAWREGVRHAVKYYQRHGDLKVPKGFVMEDGYKLGNFVRSSKSKGRMEELMDVVENNKGKNE